MMTFDEFWDDIIEYSLELNYKYHEYKSTFKQANGCGAKGSIKVPDHFLWLYITATCNIHDIEWHLAKNHDDLIKANQRWRRNMEKIIDQKSANWLMVRLRRRLAYRYYTEVKMIGTNSYAKDRGFL